MANQVVADRNSDAFLKELERSCARYRDMAIKLGATEAAVAPAGVIALDPRVQLRCQSPRCPQYGRCANCPPYFQPSFDWCRSVIGAYRQAVIFTVRFAPELAAGKRNDEQKKKYGEITRLANKVMAEISAAAFYDGYHLVLGVGAGACKAHLCPNDPCQALNGGACRHPLKSHVSGEGLCIDYFVTAARLGWEIYAIGGASDPAAVPVANRLAMVLID